MNPLKSSTESAGSIAWSINSNQLETLDKSEISRTNFNQVESVKGDHSAFELVFEQNVQEEHVDDASQLTGSVTADNMTFDELDGEDAADEPAVSLKKALIYGAECLSFDQFGP